MTAEHKRLDVFISNAGIGSRSLGSERRTSADGHELRFAVNYLSGFLLAYLLLPLLKAAAPSRIVNVASLGQHPLDFDDVMLTKGYTGTRAYAQSKLAQIMFTIDLAQELKSSGVTVNALHPATYMNTTMVREGGIAPISTVEQGGEAILHLAEGDDVAGKSGLFSTACGNRKPIRRPMMRPPASDCARLASNSRGCRPRDETLARQNDILAGVGLSFKSVGTGRRQLGQDLCVVVAYGHAGLAIGPLPAGKEIERATSRGRNGALGRVLEGAERHRACPGPGGRKRPSASEVKGRSYAGRAAGRSNAGR